MLMKYYAPNRCELSIKVMMKMGVQWGFRVFVECQGGCKREQRIEVIVKIQKTNPGGGVESLGGRVVVFEVFVELKQYVRVAVGGCQGGSGWGCQGGCERRI